MISSIIVDMNPLTADIQIKGRVHCAELLVFFSFFSSEGSIILFMKYCFNVFCLLSSGFLCKAASKQKKVHQKIYTRTNFMEIFPQIVPRHMCICQHSTQGVKQAK